MKLIKSIKQIISEASKKKILMDKIGFNEDNANLLDTICGPLSVWMAKKMMEFQQYSSGRLGNQVKTGSELIDQMNNNGILRMKQGFIQSIMDWVRVGLNGNLGENKDLPFTELVLRSKEWHDSLEIGQGDINYKEENPTILDFTDENGNGFYWADLNTKNSEAE